MPRFLLLPLVALTLTACRNDTPDPAPVAAASAPVEPAGQLHEDRFGLAWQIAPAPVAGQETVLRYMPEMAGGGPIAALDTVHERLSHLIVVSQDLSFFDHVHAVRAEGGAFVLPYTFPSGGPYVLFADYTPTGANTQLFREPVQVSGAERAAQPLGAATTEATSGGLTVTLGLPEEGLRTGAHLTLRFRVRDAAGDVTDIEPYLGAGGHVVVIPEGANGFLHVHPEEAMGEGHSHSDAHGAHADGPNAYGPEIRFMTTFPAAGRYKLWLQVQRAGQIHTFPFVLDLAA
jgi:P-type Cu+ transporter